MIYLLIFSSVALIVLVATLIYVALKFSEAFRDALSLTQATHSRSLETLEDVLDRFMAVDFAEYKLQKTASEFEYAEQELPEAQEEVGQIFRAERKKGEADEDAILAEDFPDLPRGELTRT